jgi:hypothetical protein
MINNNGDQRTALDRITRITTDMACRLLAWLHAARTESTRIGYNAAR